jgi:Rrf2 family protein
MLLDMARHYQEGPIQLGEIAKRQEVSIKYLEQIIIPLKKARYIESVRGPKGGHILAKSPEQITVAEIVAVLETGVSLVECVDDPGVCGRASICPTRLLWKDASEAMLAKFKAVTLADLLEQARTLEERDSNPDP